MGDSLSEDNKAFCEVVPVSVLQIGFKSSEIRHYLAHQQHIIFITV